LRVGPFIIARRYSYDREANLFVNNTSALLGL
jgi:hypothetical protein